jgi:hypothetical protein
VQAQLICLLCFLQHRRSMNMHMKRPERVAMGKEDWLIGSKRAERGKVRCGHGILRAFIVSFRRMEGFRRRWRGRRSRAIRRRLFDNHVEGTVRKEMSHQHLQNHSQ